MTALELIKSVENRAALMLFMDDPQAKKLLVAWTLYQPKCTDRALKRGETLEQACSSLWEATPEVDFEQLSDLSGVPLLTAVKLFDRLKNARVIFPDGTMVTAAHNLIVSEVGLHIENTTPDSWKKAAAKEREKRQPASEKAK